MGQQITVEKAREAARQFEQFPAHFWDLVAHRRVPLETAPLYCFALKSWWERNWNPHWNPQATREQAFVEPLLIGTSTWTDYFGVERLALGRLFAKLQAAPTRGGDPLLWSNPGKGSGSKRQFRLYAIREPGQLLDKWGQKYTFDKVHHGFFLPWGNVWHGQVTRYFDADPFCTLEAGGLFLWLLHRANKKALETGQSQRGLGVVRETVVFTRRETRAPLRVHLESPPYQKALSQLEKLGWIRPVLLPKRQRQPQLSYAITEAPATIIEFIALALAAQHEQPMHMADVWITEVLSGTRGIVWVSSSARELGWPLTSAGYDLACVEINRLRMLTDTFSPASTVPDYVLDTINAFPEESDRGWLTGNVVRLIRQQGLTRVWDVIYAAQQQLAQQPESIHAPVGWIKAALKADPAAWPLPHAPLPVDYSKYTADGPFAYLFSQ